MKKLTLPLIITGLLTIVACSGDSPWATTTSPTRPAGSTSGSTNPGGPAAPSVDFARANPSTIAPGGTALLEWSSSHVVSVRVVNHYSPDITLFTGPPSGSFGVSPEESTSYDILFKGEDNSEPQRNVRIVVE